MSLGVAAAKNQEYIGRDNAGRGMGRGAEGGGGDGRGEWVGGGGGWKRALNPRPVDVCPRAAG
jgi:hypothetical protein